MAVRLKDLSPEVRKQVEAQHGLGKKGRKLSDSESVGPGLPGHCICGEEFETYQSWEKHKDSSPPGREHSRWCIIFPANKEGVRERGRAAGVPGV